MDHVYTRHQQVALDGASQMLRCHVPVAGPAPAAPLRQALQSVVSLLRGTSTAAADAMASGAAALSRPDTSSQSLLNALDTVARRLIMLGASSSNEREALQIAVGAMEMHGRPVVLH